MLKPAEHLTSMRGWIVPSLTTLVSLFRYFSPPVVKLGKAKALDMRPSVSLRIGNGMLSRVVISR